MAELREQMELTEQNMSSEELKQLRDYYREVSYEATGEMKEYYQQKAEEAQAAFSEALQEEGEAKREQRREERDAMQREWREYKAAHWTHPVTGVTSSKGYIYDMEKEYAKNGDSARYRELKEEAAKAKLREENPELYK